MAMMGGGESQASPAPTGPVPFGKYLLLERIAVGGMAEVFLAKSFGIKGFERILAIKRIIAAMAEDQSFIQMFIDEAKIAGHLSHANIASIHELGKIGNAHYIAMEHVWGKDLLQIMNRHRLFGQRMPAARVAFVAARMCEALDYAHNKRDVSGKPLELIHRDVSPQNVLVSFDGQVKLIDFGIAKAQTRTTKTVAGFVKGKFGYMSPEQVRGKKLDARSDIFAVGICMYEMLTCERLFMGESDFETMDMIRVAKVNPLVEVVPGIPKELAAIVHKALARDASDRYQSAGEMHHALMAWLVPQKPPITAARLAEWMGTAFEDEMKEEKARLDAYRMVGPEQLTRSSGGHAITASGEFRAVSSVPDAPLPPEDEDEATIITRHSSLPPDLEDWNDQPTQVFFSDAEREAEAAKVDPDDNSGPAEDAPTTPGTLTAPVADNPARTDRREPVPVPKPRREPTPSAGMPKPTLATPPVAPKPASMPPPPPPKSKPPEKHVLPSSEPLIVGVTSGRGIPLAPGFTGGVRAGREALAAALATPRGRLFAIGIAMAGLFVGYLMAQLGGFLSGDRTSLRVVTVPAAGTHVAIDGQPRGQAPVELREIEPGTHVIEVSAPGYRTTRQQVEVEEGASATIVVPLDRE